MAKLKVFLVQPMEIIQSLLNEFITSKILRNVLGTSKSEAFSDGIEEWIKFIYLLAMVKVASCSRGSADESSRAIKPRFDQCLLFVLSYAIPFVNSM